MFLDYKEIIKLKNNISYQDDVFSYPVSKPRKKRNIRANKIKVGK